jgi:phage anti-repressor protein
MLKINENKMIFGTEIHKSIESKNKRFDIWVKRVIEYADLKKDKDFCTKLYESTGGRPFMDYEFTIEAAKEICLLERNEKGKQIRRWLIGISDKVESKELLNHDQIIALSSLIGFFRYIENQDEILRLHSEQFVKEHNKNRSPFAEFHEMRNRILGISKETIDNRLKEYCIEQAKRMPNLKTKKEKILFIDAYESIKNAVWDFLYMDGALDALKLSELASKMAKAQGMKILECNEDNLFQNKEALPSIMNLQLTS